MRDVLLQEYSKKHTSAATQIVVEAYNSAYPQARWVIDYIEAGGSAAGDLQILDDNNTAVDGYFFSWGAGGQVRVEKQLKNLPVGRGFRYSTTNGGNHNVVFKYHLEQLNY